MIGIVPAAGKGSRLGAVTASRPKGLVPVGGRPLLAHVYESLAEIDVDRIVTVVGQSPSPIEAQFGGRFGEIPLKYVVQPQPTGLADAVRRGCAAVDAERVVILNGDNVFGESIAPAAEQGQLKHWDGAILREDVPLTEASKTGVLQSESGQVTEIEEKPTDPPSTRVVTGCYVLPAVVEHACALVTPSNRGELELADAIQLLVAAGYRIADVPYDGWRINVNTAQDLQRANERLNDPDADG